MSYAGLHAYKAWDVPTRVFHWVNFVCILGLAAIGTGILYEKELGLTNDGKILLKTAHVSFGYVFAINLIWRILWAFVGNRHAGIRAILPYGSGYASSIASYLRGLARGDAPAYVGHNPIARFMVTFLFILLIVQAATGLMLAGTDIYYPPFGGWIAQWIAAPGVDPSTLAPYNKTGIDPAQWDAMRAFRSWFVTTHLWSFYTLVIAIVLHITGVVVTELREGGTIVSAMFTGRKVFDRVPVDDPASKV